MGGGGGTVYTLAEVASHDSRNDCWLIIENKVFDNLPLRLNVGRNSLHGFSFLFDGFLVFGLVWMLLLYYGNG